MTDKKKPFYNWYASDFLGSQFVISLEPLEEFCYRRLLDMQATSTTGRISDDPKILRNQCKKVAGFTQIWSVIKVKFEPHPDGTGGLANLRLMEILEEREEFLDGRSRAGNLGNERKRELREREAKERGTHTILEWEILKELTDYKCVKCGNNDTTVMKDYIVSIYKGGSDSIENLQPLCRSCNSGKGREVKDYVSQTIRKQLAQRTVCEPQTTRKHHASTSTSTSTSKSLTENSSSPLKISQETDDDNFREQVRRILREIPNAENVIISPKDIALCRASGISLADIDAGCWLGMGRHLASSSAAIPIRTFSFFIPICEEVRQGPPEPGYLDYVKTKIRNFTQAVQA